jgi:hypothetical protein
VVQEVVVKHPEQPKSQSKPAEIKPKPKPIEITKKKEEVDESNKYALALIPVKDEKPVSCTDLVPVSTSESQVV